MNETTKVGIITVYGEFNYGNKLQNYAVLQIYKELNCSPWTIRTFQDALRLKAIDKIKRIIITVLSYLPVDTKYKRIRNREKNFITFSKAHLNTTKKMWTSKVDFSLINSFDVLSVGSDQVWNDHDFSIYDVNYFSLNGFACKKKIALAGSIGKESFRDEYVNDFKKGLSDFNLITCREKGGVDYLTNLLNRDITLCCDPTLFLSKEEWMRLASKPKWLKAPMYVLYYFLGSTNEYDFHSDLEVIDLLDRNSCAFTSGPAEFIYLIANAKCIYTDSFHACVFSFLFHRPFLVFDREQTNLAPMNSRIDTFLNKFQIQERKYSGKNNQEKFQCHYEKAYDILEKEKNNSMCFLRSALDIGDENKK